MKISETSGFSRKLSTNSEIIQRMFWVGWDTGSRESWDFRVANITVLRDHHIVFQNKSKSTFMFCFFEFYFNLEIFSNLQKSWKNITKNSLMPLRQIHQLLTFCRIWFIILYFYMYFYESLQIKLCVLRHHPSK